MTTSDTRIPLSLSSRGHPFAHTQQDKEAIMVKKECYLDDYFRHLETAVAFLKRGVPLLVPIEVKTR